MSGPKVLYEIRQHASKPYVPTYPPLPQSDDDGGRGGFSSILSITGVSQLKEKWTAYWSTRKAKKPTSLFISPRGERIAVAAGNHITILRKEDDYQEGFGTFTSSISSWFTSGVWSETHDILGLVDDTGTLVFIKANGEEITRVTKRHLKVSSSLVGVIEDNRRLQSSYLCTFGVLTSDGILSNFEISREPSASISAKLASNGLFSTKQQFSHQISCFDYHPDFYYLLAVGSAVRSSTRNSGPSYISLWRKNQNSGLEPLYSMKFEGLYCDLKDDQSAHPKVLISPQSTHAATLDMNGCLHIFQLDKENNTFLNLVSENSSDTQMTILKRWKESLGHVVDFTWWSNHILALVKRSGNISMFDVCSFATLQEDDPVYSMPVVDRVQRSEGHLFLLESLSLEEGSDHSNPGRDMSEFHQLSNSRMSWRLISFSEKSIPEMYTILISKRKYQEALEFADLHGLDRDEVLKSKWMHSDKGVNEINMILSKIKDQVFVLCECIDTVGPTEDAVKALLAYGLRLTNQCGFSKSDDQESNQLWDLRMARLRLLQFSDRLETYLGINMGRFSMQEYCRFRIMPINEVATALAESGKIGALNLLFKRHPYSLAPSMLQILAAIPETVPVQTYAQLLPGRSPPTSMAIREQDWVECDSMISFISKLSENDEITTWVRTEPIVKRHLGFLWPSAEELSLWYKNRARDIDSSSGLLDNCLFLVDFACRKGLSELQQFYEDISYLHQIIYSDDNDGGLCFTTSLVAWEQLSDYEKFKTILEGVKEDNVVNRLHNKAIPFMQKRFAVTSDHYEDSFLAKWLKEVATRNDLDMCSTVIEEGCANLYSNHFFRDENEAIDCALRCIYSCTLTDRWSTMATLLSKLPQSQEIQVGDLEKRVKLVEGHIEAGRLLAIYQVPKPVNFFLDNHIDEKGVKQILRLMLSKFVRRQPGRSDNEWACMWHDLHSLRERAFPFLDLEFMLTEFCRGLLKAGKFSLARNYLKGTSSVVLQPEKAENLVVQAAKEYFFSASSLASEEIWKARECLNIFSNCRTIKAEADIIDAVTVKLPDLGVSLLPVQFKQIKDPMEIVKMAVTGQAGAYLHVEELIEVAKLLGLSSSEDISYVEEAIAREAAVAGDLQLAFDLCLVLTKKGHGHIWDLCAAIARGPALEHMDVGSRKQLLGFALSHCDDESISELLQAWKDLDMQGQFETLGMTMNSSSHFRSGQHVFGLRDQPQMVDETRLENIKSTLLEVAKSIPVEGGSDLETFLTENGKLSAFAATQLPWLLKLSRSVEYKKKLISDSIPGKQFVSAKATAVNTILSWLARHGFAPRDDLIALLAESIIEPPVTKEEDIMGCSFLLNLVDASNAVEVIEEQLRARENYQDVRSIMNLGMTYSLLHDSGVECTDPTKRRELLWKNFKRKQMEQNSDESKIDEKQSTFWREWKLQLEEKMSTADRSRVLERIIPGVETDRFLSGDISYIQTSVFSLIESVKLEKKRILKDLLKLADTYGMKRSTVILHYLSSTLVSEIWTNEDIMVEILEVKQELMSFASETIKIISDVVYPEVNGRNKLRLAYIYGLLSECYLLVEDSKESLPKEKPNQRGSHVGLAYMYKIYQQECSKVNFIADLDFKNVAGLGGLDLERFNNEVFAHINEASLEPLANMVHSLRGLFPEQVPETLVSSQDVYMHYVSRLLDVIEHSGGLSVESTESFQGLVSKLEQTYDHSKIYIRLLQLPQALNVMKRYFISVMPQYGSYKDLPDSSSWQECLILLMNFWIRLAEEMQDLTSSSVKSLGFNPACIKSCLNVLMRLVVEDSVSPSQAWSAITGYLNCGLVGDFATEFFNFCKAMVSAGCGFGAISQVFSEAFSQYPKGLQDLPHLYLSILEPIMRDIASGSIHDPNLYQLLSSLSNSEGDLDGLKKVRQVVWDELATFSENLELPGQIRVHALELMQLISGRNIKGFSSELQSHVLPWEGWEEQQFNNKTETAAYQGLPDKSENSSNLTNTLVALRSSQIAASISPELDISPEDLSSIETAVSCYLKLSEGANTTPQVDALLVILKEWEGLFDTKEAELSSMDASNLGNEWGNDDWDEGWETFPDAKPLEKEHDKKIDHSIHPLHLCWLEILKKYTVLSRYRDVLRLLDQCISKDNQVIVDETGAETLSRGLIGTDCFVALKFALLLPYEATRARCLSAVEDKLQQEGIPDTSDQDQNEFLLLILHSGVFSIIITNPSYGSIFSYLCFIVGSASRQFQETQLSKYMKKDKNDGKNTGGEDLFFLFGRVLFPCFVSELVKADQKILAGFVVTKFMHTNPSLTLINVAEATLRRYLEKQLDSAEQLEFSPEDLGYETLKNSVLSLKDRSGDLIRSALSSLSPTSSNSR